MCRTLMLAFSARDSKAGFTLVEGDTLADRLFTTNCGTLPFIVACTFAIIEGREISSSIGSSAEEPVPTQALFGKGRGLFLASANESGWPRRRISMESVGNPAASKG